jgi:tripartite-type tricarboxylate transporter receptor subunit TctC
MRLLVLAFAACLAAPVYSQVYPVQPIKLVVPFAAGGGADVIGRLLAERLTGILKQQVTVENRPGGGGTFATREVSKAAPDGYTLLYVTTATLVTGPIFLRTPGYDPLRSLVPISLLSTQPAMTVVNPKIPARNMEELTALIKASPGRYRYAHAGVGSLSYLSGELFKSQTGLDIKDVSVKGPAAATQSVINGDADMMFDLALFFVFKAREGQVRPLAVMGYNRVPGLPDVPTVAEAGMPELTAYNWTGLVAPSGTPPETIDVVNRAVHSVLSEIETQATFQKHGTSAEGSTPAQFHRLIEAELVKWARALPLSATAQ